MRRIFAVLLALLLGMSACALAEEYVRIEIGDAFSVERPASLEVVELTEDDAAEGMVYAASNDELEMYIWLYDLEDSKEELYAMYQEDDFLDRVDMKTVGSIEYLEYQSENEIGAVFTIVDNQYYELVFYCETDDAMAQAQTTLASLSVL